jgi:RNA polymerase sigma-70 factor (ECF subfamily)
MVAERPTPDPVAEPARYPSVDPVSDASLLREMIEGSQDALASLYDRHGGAVFAAAMRACRDSWMAAEVVQETFLALWNRAELFDPSRGTLTTWLLAIARNRAIDRLRAAGRHERAATFSSFARTDAEDHSVVEWLTASGELIGTAGPEPGPEIALFSKETRASIQDALASLGPLERCVIALAYDAGLSQSEIAAQLGWPLGTVKTRTRRAIRRLRDRLESLEATVRAPGSGAHRITGEPARSPRSRDAADCLPTSQLAPRGCHA